MTGIGTLQETSLHADLKAWYTRPGDLVEISLDGYFIDIVRGKQLIEIQTGSFSSIKRKLVRLLETHPVRVVYPIPREKWILRVTNFDEILARRRSPKRGQFVHLFAELVRLSKLVVHPNFSLEVVFINEEDIWRDDGRGSWRRKGWSIADRKLVEVLETVEFCSPQDYRRLLPEGLPAVFTVNELASALRQQRHLASKMVYCLREMGVIHTVGKRGRAWEYTSEVM